LWRQSDIPHVIVSAPSRLHLGLIGLTEKSLRSFGGAGFAISHMRTIVRADQAIRRGPIIHGLDGRRRKLLRAALNRADMSDVRITVLESAPPHSGFGSGTSIILSSLEAAHILHGKIPSKKELVVLSGRGRGSGVGVTTYFEGGFVVEFGHHRELDTKFMPSSAARPGYGALPSYVSRIDWPEDWLTTVVYPRQMLGLEGEGERNFMCANTPLSFSECAAVAFALCFELPGAVADRDFPAFKLALRHARHYGFKNVEIERLKEVSGFMDKIDRNLDIGVAMSSFGPAILVVSREDVVDPIRKLVPFGWDVIQGEVSRRGRQVLVSSEALTDLTSDPTP
jgi:beta-ribofuranosylaminobenzene 5'-phosphate synthase